MLKIGKFPTLHKKWCRSGHRVAWVTDCCPQALKMPQSAAGRVGSGAYSGGSALFNQEKVKK